MNKNDLYLILYDYIDLKILSKDYDDIKEELEQEKFKNEIKKEKNKLKEKVKNERTKSKGKK